MPAKSLLRVSFDSVYAFYTRNSAPQVESITLRGKLRFRERLAAYHFDGLGRQIRRVINVARLRKHRRIAVRPAPYQPFYATCNHQKHTAHARIKNRSLNPCHIHYFCHEVSRLADFLLSNSDATTVTTRTGINQPSPKLVNGISRRSDIGQIFKPTT